MITAEANSLLQDIHNRMPVILKRHDIPTWLNLSQEEDSIDEVLGLIRPYDGNDLDFHPVSDYVNNTGNDGRKCIQPVQYKLF